MSFCSFSLNLGHLTHLLFCFFGQYFAMALKISKTFDTVWSKPLISKFSSFSLYAFLCSLSNFLSSGSVAVDEDNQRLYFKSLNTRVRQGSYFILNFFPIF